MKAVPLRQRYLQASEPTIIGSIIQNVKLFVGIFTPIDVTLAVILTCLIVSGELIVNQV